MFEIPELGEQTIYCRQNNIGEGYPNLSNENIAPIRYYSSQNGHEALNSGLANNNLSHKLSNYADRLGTSLNNCDKFYGKLYRGLPFNVDANWVNARYTIGEETTELTFLSTSTDKGVAIGFAENLMYEINAIGNKGADIRNFSLSSEGEITYLNGTKFRIDNIKTPAENNGIWLIKMTEIQ